MQYINLNGKILPAAEATLAVDNGAFRYGHGLFETMLVQDGNICLAAYHWERLFAGMQQLYFEVPALMTPQYFRDQVLHTVQRNRAEHLCRVRMQIYAGGGGLYSAGPMRPRFVIECFTLPDAGYNQNGLVTGIATGVAKSPDSLANMKSCNALIYAVAARQAKAQQWNDALVCNTQSHIIESTIANIFWVKDGAVYTPPLTDGCIAGVMRRHIMAIAPVREKSLTLYELTDADEVFLTNAVKRIRWVASVAGYRYGNTFSAQLSARL